MSYTLLLLGLLLIGTVHSQSTTGSPTTNGGLDVVKDSKDKADDLIFIKADNLTGSGDGDLQPEASADRVAFTLDDVRNPMGRTPTTPSDDDLNEEGSDEVVDDVTQELTMFQALLNNGLKLMNNTSNDSDTKKEEDDEDSDEDGEDDEVSYPIPEPTQDFKQEESQIKRQDEPNPEFGENKQSESMFNQPNRDETEPESPIYLTVNDQPSDSESSNDNPPILQLTQGGYQRLPYPTSLSADFAQFSPSNNRMRQRLRSQSASQQAESIENPLSDEQSRQPQATPQVSYTNPFQQPFGFGSVLGLRHPFVPPDSFVNGNGMMPQPAQNGGFFNTPPAGFTDWTQLSSSNDGGFQVLQRNPQGISLFQTPSEQVLPNPYMVRNQQYPQTQLFSNDPSQPTQIFYQTRGFPGYASSDNFNDASRPDYSALLRGGSPNVQFQMNSNPFSPPRSASGMLYNPMINAQPNFDNGSPFSPRYYPAPNQQVPVQSAAPQPQRQRDPDTPMKEDGKKEDQINTSPDKEDPTSVPFGTRIQSQGGREGQSDFPSQRDVYIRYPISEAGYATEESLPVQNTTTKSDTNGDSPTRAVFPFFQHPGPFPGYNGPDPYRNALNAVQPGFPIDSNAQSSDDNNNTKFIQPDQFIQNVPYPFNQPPGSQRQPGALFSGYSGGNPSLFQTSDDDGAGNPFDQMTLFPDSNYRFPTPLQARAPTPDSNKTPACAQENNASICFDDPEYPRRDVSFALNSDSFVMNRFAMPDQQLDAMSLIEDKLQDPKKPNDFICNSDIKYGMPLRAKDVKGKWKVIVNMDKNTGGGRFTQPVRLEVCKNAGEQCNFTQVKTACVQKFSLHRLLSWSRTKAFTTTCSNSPSHAPANCWTHKNNFTLKIKISIKRRSIGDTDQNHSLLNSFIKK